MADVSLLSIVNGVPTTGTGEVATLIPVRDALSRGILAPVCSFTRPSNATQYAAGDAWADVSAPAGGGTLTGVVAVSGKAAIATHAKVVSSNGAPVIPLQGEFHLFDTAPTAIADNAAWTVTAAQMLTSVLKIPFALTVNGGHQEAEIELAKGFLTVGSANLRVLCRVLNAYTPVSAEVLSLRLFCHGIN